MKPIFKIYSILFIGGLLAVFILFNGVGAQEIDKERAISIVQTQGGPGGCTDGVSCSAFCDNRDNYVTCISWARDNGLVSDTHAERAKRIAEQARDFSGPGECRSPEQCHAFCEQPQNHETCIDFAVSQGFMTQEEANRIKEFRREGERFREETERERERFEQEFEVDPEFDKDRALKIIESQGGPGGCGSMEECEQFCENPKNQEVCFEFAERHNLFKNRGHAERIKKVLKEGGPGGCRGESQCRQFCENPDNFEVCLNFAQQNEFLKPEQVEKARRGIEALKDGPGDCRGPKECEEFCRRPGNQDVCFEWAKRHGLMSEEELRRIEEFKKRGEELREEFERRDEEFKPPEGFKPPGEFLGPGGCKGAEECRKYCEDTVHKDECERFRTPSGGQPPGFGGTPPPGYSPSPEGYEAQRVCFKKGGIWTGTACEFHEGTVPPPEYTPGPRPAICPSMPTVDSCPAGYRKVIAFSLPECGTYYKCDLEEGYTAPPYTQSPQSTYSPMPDPASECSQKGGVWNFEKKTCVFEKSSSILQNSGAYLKGAFRDFFK